METKVIAINEASPYSKGRVKVDNTTKFLKKYANIKIMLLEHNDKHSLYTKNKLQFAAYEYHFTKSQTPFVQSVQGCKSGLLT